MLWCRRSWTMGISSSSPRSSANISTTPILSIKPADAVGRARMRLWTKQLDEGVHAATSVVGNAIAFRYQKLAIGMEELEKFHQKMPDPVKRERSWENVTKGIDSRYFSES